MPDLTEFSFTPATGYEDANEYPTNAGTEAQKRADFMKPLNQLKTFLNGTLKTIMDGKADKAQEAWRTDVVWANSWVSHTPTYPLSFRKNNFGMVEFKGMTRGGTVGVTAFTLPASYWPLQEHVVPVVSNGSVSGVVSVGTDGTVKVLSGNNTYVSLDGLQIPTN